MLGGRKLPKDGTWNGHSENSAKEGMLKNVVIQFVPWLSEPSTL